MSKKTERTETAITDATGDLDSQSFSTKLMKAMSSEGDCNTNERAYEIREILESPEVEDYSALESLEDTWRLLSHYYGDWDGEPLVSRVENPDRTANSPIENFAFHVEMGFYPPPEVMLVIGMCVQEYLSMGGDISLDEAFFGKPHKKRTSYAHRKHQVRIYGGFHHLEVGLHQKRAQETGQPQKSLEQLAEQHLNSTCWGENRDKDVDTFLRGYRRWKNQQGVNGSKENGE